MKKKFEINFKIILLIIIFSSIIGIVYNTLSSKGISIFQDPKAVNYAEDILLFNSTTPDSTQNVISRTDSTQAEVAIKPEEKSKNITVVKALDLNQAYKLFSSDKALFIDARDQWDFAEGHIKGSINIPYYKFDKSDPNLKSINKSKIIITYCDGDDCGMSKKLASDLLHLGYDKVYYFFGGWAAWTKSNYPIEKSESE